MYGARGWPTFVCTCEDFVFSSENQGTPASRVCELDLEFSRIGVKFTCKMRLNWIPGVSTPDVHVWPWNEGYIMDNFLDSLHFTFMGRHAHVSCNNCDVCRWCTASWCMMSFVS